MVGQGWMREEQEQQQERVGLLLVRPATKPMEEHVRLLVPLHVLACALFPAAAVQRRI